MKKILAVFIIAAMMICATLPASAIGDPPDGLRDEVYYKYTYPLWEEYCERVANLPVPPINLHETYESFCAENFEPEGFFFCDYLGTYADGTVTIWVVSPHALGVRSHFFGDYYISDGCISYDAAPGLTVYKDGSFISFEEAYEEGIIDDADLAALCASDPIIGCGSSKSIYRLGDMNGDNLLDASDIMDIKAFVMSNSYNDFSDDVYRHHGDFDKSGYIDIGDIMALKNHIMQNA